MSNSGLSVLGPYRDRDRWRLVLLEGRDRKSLNFPTRQQAEQSKRLTLERLLKTRCRTCGEVLKEFSSEGTARGLLPTTSRAIERALARFLPLDAPIAALSPARAAELYKEETQRLLPSGKPVAAASHHNLLRRAKLLFRFAKERGYVQRDPFLGVKPLGRCRVGKPQLRIEEARRFEATASKMAQDGDAGALGVLLMLRLGLRRGEVLARVARDVDDGGRLLWIPHGKTRNARRRLEIPPVLQPLMQRLAEGHPPDSLIFGTNRANGVRDGTFLWLKVREICERARVPPVCPHSLRGLHATLAIEGGATHAAVAAALGHSSFAITARHYADAGALDRTSARRVSATLSDPIERILAELDETQRETLLRRLTDGTK